MMITPLPLTSPTQTLITHSFTELQASYCLQVDYEVDNMDECSPLILDPQTTICSCDFQQSTMNFQPIYNENKDSEQTNFNKFISNQEQQISVQYQSKQSPQQQKNINILEVCNSIMKPIHKFGVNKRQTAAVKADLIQAILKKYNLNRIPLPNRKQKHILIQKQHIIRRLQCIRLLLKKAKSNNFSSDEAKHWANNTYQQISHSSKNNFADFKRRFLIQIKQPLF